MESKTGLVILIVLLPALLAAQPDAIEIDQQVAGVISTPKLKNRSPRPMFFSIVYLSARPLPSTANLFCDTCSPARIGWSPAGSDMNCMTPTLRSRPAN
jgi:hypothetical protein